MSRLILSFKEKIMTNKIHYYSGQQTIAANQNVKERDYWLNQLSGELVRSSFPYDSYLPQQEEQNHFRSVEFKLSGELFETLMRISNNQDHAIHIILVAGIVLLLDKYNYNGSKDIILGSPIYKQERDAEFINTLLPLRSRLEPGLTFKELLMQVRQTIIEAEENQNYPVAILCEQLNIESSGSQYGFPLFDIALLLEGIHDKEYLRGIQTNMTFLFSKADGYLQGDVEYNPHLYHPDSVQGITSHLTHLLYNVLGNVDQKVVHVDMLSLQERERLLHDFNDNNADFPRQRSIFHFIEDHARQTPHRTALVCPQPGAAHTHVAYGELNQRANRLAWALLDAGVRKDQPVGILMQRSPQMVESILAVWKAGGAYIPIDTHYPAQRINQILKDSGCKVCIAQSPYVVAQLAEEFQGQLISLDRDSTNIAAKSGCNLDLELDMDGLAYIIYTSGSTGKPKGAMIEHIGMMNHIQAKINHLRLTSDSIVAQNATHTFDISVWQFFVALVPGGKTVIYTNESVMAPARFMQQLVQHQVSILEVVPSYLSIMLDTLVDTPHLHLSLYYLMVTGEEIKPHLVEKWFAAYPHIKVVNAYGPTEASDDITHFIMDRLPETERIPIGQPLQNFNIYIVDRQMQLCPIGVNGEICVAGIGVGRGYLKDEEKTKQVFMSDPFNKDQEVRLYKTGDLGRWLPDGTIDFLGRIDHQVKIRGFRIECGEIENTLLNHDHINEAVVMAKVDQNKNKYLAAYLVASARKEEEGLDIDLIRNHLAEVLPDYMIPAYFITLDRFPLTAGGKIDKKALPEPQTQNTGETEYTAPETQMEKCLADIWQQVLELDRIGVHDNFFIIGGDSIKGIRIVNKIQQQMEEIVHVAMIYETPTIKKLAAALDRYQEHNGSRIDAPKAKEFHAIIPPLTPFKTAAPKNPCAAFILSPPRTGSTLLRVMLAGHSQLFAPPELELLSFNTLQDRKTELSGSFRHFTEGTVRALMDLENCGPEEAKATMDAFEKDNLTVKEFYRQLQLRMGDRLLVDKTANYSLSLEALKRAEDYFDSPRYIHLTRNPYAAIHSYEKAKLDQVFRYKHPFSLRELAELVWLISEENIIRFLKQVPKERQYFVRFEDLVANPRDVVSSICEFLSIPFREEMLQVYQETEKKMTNGLYAESRMIGDVKFSQHSRINTDVADKWRENHHEDFLGDNSIETARSLGYLTRTPASYFANIPPTTSQADHYPLSHAQKRLWILHQLAAGQTVYNIPAAFRIQGELHSDALERAFQNVIERHEILRTTFTTLDGEPIQRIHHYDSNPFKLQYVDLSEEQNRDQKAEALVNQDTATAFDLVEGPLLRGTLLHIEEQNYIFLFTMHHIITDGWSSAVLVEDILIAYNAYIAGRENSLPSLTLQYKDYAVWQNGQEQKEMLQLQKVYWQEQFSDEIPVLDLPIDFPRPTVQRFDGSALSFELGIEETRALKALVSAEETTLYVGLLALYTIFLAKVSNNESIVVGTPVAGRHHPDIEKIIGMFVNTLALRNNPAGEKTFSRFLNETKENTIVAFNHQDYQYEELVELVEVERDAGRNPLFDTMFSMQNNSLPEIEMPGLTLLPYEYKINTSKFDMTLTALEQDDKLLFSFIYSTVLFRVETIQRFTGYFKRVVSQALEHPGGKLSDIDILPDEEKQQLIYDFNATETAFPQDKTIHQLFAEQAARIPDTIAITAPSTNNTPHLTYKKLNEQSNRLARVLWAKGVDTGSIVVIKTQRSLEMIIGILAILKVGGLYMPVEAHCPGARLRYLLADSSADIILTQKHLAFETGESLRSWTGQTVYLEDECVNNKDANGLNVSIDTSSPAYLFYTSGTTGKPKGVLVKHCSVVNLVSWFGKYYRLEKSVRVLQMSEYTFDASVNQIFGTLLHGASLYLIYRGLLTDIQALRTFIRDKEINVIYFVPALLKELLVTGEKLQSLQTVISGADRLEDRVKDMLLAKGYRLYNQYGPTETTVDALAAECSAEKVSLGTPIANVRCYILDNYYNVLPIGIAGELYIGGAGVALGYLNKPQLTAEKFVKNNRSNRSYGAREEKLYRTGDLAKWLPDGSVVFLGRRDHQVKIRGFRIEPGEIENLLINHNKVKEAVVTAIDRPGSADATTKGGEKYLCAHFVPTGPVKTEEIKAYLEGKLPGYMIPSYIIPLPKIPLTANGKVDRGALPTPEFRAVSEYIAPRTPIEKKLARIWTGVLEIRDPHSSKEQDPGIDDNFFQLGGHSLKATVLTAKIHKAFNVKLPLVEIFKTPTIRGLSQSIKEAEKDSYIAITPVEKKDRYPLASAQKRIYILQQMDEAGTGYNMPAILVLEGSINKDRLENTFQQLIRRHESLRTSFKTIDGEPQQIIHDHAPFQLEYYDPQHTAGGMEVEHIIKNFVRPFDLTRSPLLRVGLIPQQREKQILMMDMHHIITDGTSMVVLKQEFSALYAGLELKPINIHYKEFSQWQNCDANREKVEPQETYWLNEFLDVPVLNLPYDFERPLLQSFEGDLLTFAIGPQQSAALKQLVLSQGGTLFMVLLAVYNILLSKLSGQEDIIVGSDIEGRNHPDLKQVMGMFVNVLALRNYPKGDKFFSQFFNQLKTRTLEAFENQDYQFEDLVEKVEINRDASRNPLFDVNFTLQNFAVSHSKDQAAENGVINAKPYEYDTHTAKFDLTMVAVEHQDRISFTLEYCTRLFKKQTIQRFTDYFKRIISAILDNKDIQLSAINILGNQEKNHILYQLNDTRQEVERDNSFHQLFQQQAARHPDDVAAFYNGREVTYHELDESSNQLAQVLREKGVSADSLVALLYPRSIEMLTGILGVFKAGGAYIPFDTGYPPERIVAILEDSAATVLLTTSPCISNPGEFYDALCRRTMVGHVIYLDEPEQVEHHNQLFRTYRLSVQLGIGQKIQLHEEEVLRFDHQTATYGECKVRAVQLGHFIKSISARQKEKLPATALLLSNPINRIVVYLCMNMFNISFSILDSAHESQQRSKLIRDTKVEMVISESLFLDELDAQVWAQPLFNTYIVLDNYEEFKIRRESNFRSLWNFIAEKEPTEGLNDYGWRNSYNAENFPIAEMQEYVDNFKVKLSPYLNKESRILEIGCGHGLVLFEIAPTVGYYMATDLSPVIIEKNKQRLIREGLDHAEVAVASASEIGMFKEREFDAVVCSSATHYFPNTLYLEGVIKDAIGCLKDGGIIYLDDMLNLREKESLIGSIMEYKESHPGTQAKTDWSTDLFIDADFFHDLQQKFSEIRSWESSKKLGVIENELTRFRYDVLITIDKTKKHSNDRESQPLIKNRYSYEDIRSYAQTTPVEDNWKNISPTGMAGSIIDINQIRSYPVSNLEPVNKPLDLSYVIYTSGTTGKPKGVMIHHQGMLNHLYAKINELAIDRYDIIAQTASICFDISVWQFLAGLLVGGTTYIIDKEVVLNPQQLLEVLQEAKITILETVPSLMSTFLSITEEMEYKDLQSLRWMIPTGEALPVSLVRDWSKQYPRIELVNAYGPTEASDDVTHYVVEGIPGQDQKSISIGKPLQNLHIYILDKYLSLCPIGVRGEICVSGLGIGRGYLNDPEKTATFFVPNPFLGEIDNQDHAVIYKTGDIGFFREDGNLECAGRVDHQVKIRGFRIEPGEIESQLLTIDTIKEAVVIDRKDTRGGYLCGYISAAKQVDIQEVKAILARSLPEYMIPSYILQMEAIPLTANGKVNRKALPEPGITMDEDYAAPRDRLEEGLVEIWSDILKIEKDDVGIDVNFFEVGGHSLKATIMTSKIHKELNVNIPLAEIFKAPTIRRLSQFIRAAEKESYISIQPTEQKDYYPLSSAQKRLYVIQQMEPDSTGYNIPFVVVLEGPLEKERLQGAFNQLIRRHEILRTSFGTVKGEAMQQVEDNVKFAVEFCESQEEDVREMVGQFIKPFDLDRAPLLRVKLIEEEKGKYILMVDTHHIISDGTSQAILINEFAMLYKGERLPDIRLQYKDYSQWQNSESQRKKIKSQESYWLRKFAGEIPVLKLPTDYEKSGVPGFEGSTSVFKINIENRRILNQLALEEGTTLYIVLLAVSYIFFSKICNQEDIVIGTLLAGRNHMEWQQTIGMFVNTLALRHCLKRDNTFTEFLLELKKDTLDAFENQEYQFEDLVDLLIGNRKRTLNRNPLFNVLFALQNVDLPPADISGLKLKPFEYENKVAKFDLSLIAVESEEGISVNFGYSTKLFKQETIRRFMDYYKDILSSVIEDKKAKLGRITISHGLLVAKPNLIQKDFNF
jgi:amino acid adenylation domain-containing protein